MRYAVGAGIALLAFGIIVWLGTLQVYSLPYAQEVAPPLFRGFLITLQSVGLVIPVAFTVGFLMGWSRTSRSRLARGFGAVYVEFFRSMPPLVLIVFSSLIATLLLRTYFRVEDPFAAALALGIVALALHSGAYQTEIVRAGILSVPTGQTEAAEAVGLTKLQTMFHVTLPQAFRVSLPALGNEFASVIKDTSLISAIGALDLMFQGNVRMPDALSRDFNFVFIVWAEVALFYFLLTFSVTRGLRKIENRYKVPGLEAASF